MSERRRILVLTLIMTVACASVIGISLFLTYRTHLAEERERLAVTAQSQARLIEAVARYDARMAKMMREGDLGHDASAATLGQIIDAHEHLVGFGETGEFVLARLEGDLIVFQFRRHHRKVDVPDPVFLSSDLAEPMQRALSGLSGTLVGLDYHGALVLAAHEPVGELNMGIVAKIDMSEVRAPFIRTALAAGGLALPIVLISVLLFRRIGNPIITRLEAHVMDLEQEMTERKQVEERLRITQYAIDHSSDSVALIDVDGQFAYVNESMSRSLGYSPEDMLSMGVRDIDPDLPAEAWLDHWAKLKEEGSLTFESRHRSKDGRVFPVEIVASYGEFGGKEYIFAHARDISERKKAEERIGFLSQLTEQVADSFISTDLDYKITYANQAFEELYGYSREEILGRSPGILNAEPNFEMVQKQIYETVASGKTWRSEALNRRKDGSTFSIEMVISPLFDERGRTFAYVGTQRDITERRRAEEVLKGLRLQNDLLLSAAEEGIYGLDLNGNTTFVNPAAARLIGWEPGDLIGRNQHGVLHHTRRDGTPYPAEECPIYAASKDGEVHHVDDEVFWRKDGTAFPVDYTSAPIRNEHGEIEGAVVTFRDITERKRAEQALAENMRLTQILLDSMPCIAMLLRPHSREIVALNQAAREAGAVLGKTCFATWAKFDEPCPWCMAPEQWASGEECHLELEGRGVMWDAHWIPVSEDLYMHYAFDITERKRAEQQTEDSLREKEVLLREIHHRVKNNMQVIVSLLRMHARRTADPQVRQTFQDCQERVGAMALVHETLYQSEDLARIDFENYLEKLCQNLARVHGGGLGAISVVPEATDVSLGIDQAVAVGMVVGELVSNAFKHAFPEGREGRVTVSMRETDEHGVELVVEDNGVGLPADVDPANVDTLGLKLVSATATDELGGTMEITRRAGTRFRLRFKNRAS